MLSDSRLKRQIHPFNLLSPDHTDVFLEQQEIVDDVNVCFFMIKTSLIFPYKMVFIVGIT